MKPAQNKRGLIETSLSVLQISHHNKVASYKNVTQGHGLQWILLKGSSGRLLWTW